MKAILLTISFDKEVQTKFGLAYNFYVTYQVGEETRKASFLSKSKDQKTFKAGEENEFTETFRMHNERKYYNIKPIKSGFSNYAKQQMREQTKYSGFATSYVKDLIIAGKVDIKDWKKASKDIFTFMVELDKSVQQ